MHADATACKEVHRRVSSKIQCQSLSARLQGEMQAALLITVLNCDL